MKKKNKAARKHEKHEQEQPAPAYEQLDYGTPQTSDEEGETKGAGSCPAEDANEYELRFDSTVVAVSSLDS